MEEEDGLKERLQSLEKTFCDFVLLYQNNQKRDTVITKVIYLNLISSYTNFFKVNFEKHRTVCMLNLSKISSKDTWIRNHKDDALLFIGVCLFDLLLWAESCLSHRKQLLVQIHQEKQ